MTEMFCRLQGKSVTAREWVPVGRFEMQRYETSDYDPEQVMYRIVALDVDGKREIADLAQAIDLGMGKEDTDATT